MLLINSVRKSNEGNRNIEQFALEDTVKIINNAAIALKCSVITKVKALLLYHHFKACIGDFQYGPHTTAIACLDLSIKINDEDIPVENIILLVYRMIYPGKIQSTKSKDFQVTQQNVSTVQFAVLKMLEFDLNHPVAHEYLAYFMYDIQEELSTRNTWDMFAVTCMRMASDFYFSNKCLVHKADEIAIAVVKAALYTIGADCSYFQLRLKVMNDCPEDRILNIMEDLFGICFLGSRAERRNSRQ